MEIVEMETTSVMSYLERPTAQLMVEGTDSKRKGEIERTRMQIVVEVSGEGSFIYYKMKVFSNYCAT